jgi:protein-S-isoprenylcysteine O-methyltransferase Ste14
MTLLERSLDVLAFAYALLFFPAPAFWLIIHPAIHFWRRFGNRSFWIALPVWLVNAVALSVLAPRIYMHRLPRNAFSAVLGAALLIAGLAIGRHVHRVFGLKRLGGLPEMNPGRYPGGVVQTGIYGRVRHPRYLEYMLSFVGWALLTGAAGLFVLAILSVIAYLIVAPLEERELREHYGDEYDSYAREVPRFIPRLRRPA